jgi:hypothetical protein
MRLAVAIATVLVLGVAAIFASSIVQEPATTPPAGPASPTQSSQSPATVPRPVQIAGVSDFDPLADPPEENSDLAPLAIDGDPQTAWRTVTYFDPMVDQQKAGVGLLVDLGEPVVISEVALTLIGEPTAVGIFAAEDDAEAPTALDQLTRVAGQPEAGIRTLLELDDATTTQFVVVWLTSLPEIEGGFQGQIAEIVVRS